MWGWTNLFHIFQSKPEAETQIPVDEDRDEWTDADDDDWDFDYACDGPGLCQICGGVDDPDDLEDEAP